MPRKKSLTHLADFFERYQLLLDRAQIATTRCIERAVLEDPEVCAESIRCTHNFPRFF